MYGSIVAWRLKPGALAQDTADIRGTFVPALTQQPGFQRVSLLRTGEDALTSVIVYDTREHAEEAFPRLAALVRDTIGSLVEDMQRSAGEVVLEQGS